MRLHLPRRHLGFARSPIVIAAIVVACASAVPARAADLVVRVTGIAAAAGEVGCALFTAPEGFPSDDAVARRVRLPADPAGVTCRFPDVPAGRYAVAVSHDANGNRKLDTNLIGLPTEAWGVSNNARPTMRAPRFDEARFDVADGRETVIDVKVVK
jgi:uncharacterized protein (DUF2141 family)